MMKLLIAGMLDNDANAIGLMLRTRYNWMRGEIIPRCYNSNNQLTLPSIKPDDIKKISGFIVDLHGMGIYEPTPKSFQQLSKLITNYPVIFVAEKSLFNAFIASPFLLKQTIPNYYQCLEKPLSSAAMLEAITQMKQVLVNKLDDPAVSAKTNNPSANQHRDKPLSPTQTTQETESHSLSLTNTKSLTQCNYFKTLNYYFESVAKNSLIHHLLVISKNEQAIRLTIGEYTVLIDAEKKTAVFDNHFFETLHRQSNTFNLSQSTISFNTLSTEEYLKLSHSFPERNRKTMPWYAFLWEMGTVVSAHYQLDNKTKMRVRLKRLPNFGVMSLTPKYQQKMAFSSLQNRAADTLERLFPEQSTADINSFFISSILSEQLHPSCLYAEGQVADSQPELKYQKTVPKTESLIKKQPSPEGTVKSTETSKSSMLSLRRLIARLATHSKT